MQICFTLDENLQPVFQQAVDRSHTHADGGISWHFMTHACVIKVLIVDLVTTDNDGSY